MKKKRKIKHPYKNDFDRRETELIRISKRNHIRLANMKRMEGKTASHWIDVICNQYFKSNPEYNSMRDKIEDIRKLLDSSPKLLKL